MDVARCWHWVTAWWTVCEEARTVPCQIQLLVASSNRHKAEQAEHLSQDGNTAKKMYLGKSMRNNSKNTKVSEKRGGRGALGIRAQIPLQCMERTSLEHMNIS